MSTFIGLFWTAARPVFPYLVGFVVGLWLAEVVGRFHDVGYSVAERLRHLSRRTFSHEDLAARFNRPVVVERRPKCRSSRLVNSSRR